MADENPEETTINDFMDTAADVASINARINNLVQSSVKSIEATAEGDGSSYEEHADEPESAQELTDLEISDEMAGIVYAIGVIAKSSEITPERSVNYIRQFYEYDTGRLLEFKHFAALVKHKKVQEYAERVRPRIEKRIEMEKEKKRMYDAIENPQN